MTSALEASTGHLERLKTCAPTDAHLHAGEAFRHFRFVPATERRRVADDFYEWVASRSPAPRQLLGYGLFLRALDQFMNEAHAPALALLAQARDEFAACDDVDGQGLCAMLTGATYRTLGNFDVALGVLWEGHELLRRTGHYPMFVAANANSIANIAFESDRDAEAREMFQLAFDESTRAQDFYFQVYGLHGLGKVRLRGGDIAGAETAFREAHRIADANGHAGHVSSSLTELAALHEASGRTADAESCHERALDLREAQGLRGGAITNAIHLGELAMMRGAWGEARRRLEHALGLANASDVKLKQAQAHRALATLYERTGDAASSLEHFKQFHDLRETIARADMARRLADAKVVFEAEQTRKENAVIRAQKAEIEAKNSALQATIDELTRAKIGKKARAYTIGLAIVLFIFQDAILGVVLRAISGRGYLVSLVVKMAIIFSLGPINRAIEGHMLRGVTR